MATPTSFLEQNDMHTTQTGEQYPVWVRPAKLGITNTIDTISGWQLSHAELVAVNESQGFVFVTFTGIQPPMQVLGASAVQFEGYNRIFRHPDCYDLYTYYEELEINAKLTFRVTSGWQLSAEQLAMTNQNGGVVFLRVVGGQPDVTITGINPIIL